MPQTFQVTSKNQIQFIVEPDKLHSKYVSHERPMRQPHAPFRLSQKKKFQS